MVIAVPLGAAEAARWDAAAESAWAALNADDDAASALLQEVSVKQAGRRININQDITTANGDLILEANHTSASSVGSSSRYITGSGDINVGTGSISITMSTGSTTVTQFMNPSGDMTANTITVNASNGSGQGNITLNGTLTAADTISVTNSATSTQSATTDTAKSTELDMQTKNVLGLPSNLGVQNFLGMGTGLDPTVSASVNNSNQGSGSVTRNGTLTGTISALITEILPSGNFKIEGRRSVTVNHEEQIMVLRGVIRPQDINFDNTIASISIADASISLTGEGVVADEQRKGWLAKILSKVWPF